MNLYIGAAVKVELQRKTMALLAMCNVYHVDTWLCRTRSEAGDPVIAVVHVKKSAERI